MNPWGLSASDILVWGIVLHLIADWPLQNDWMAQNKMKRADVWYIRHPAAYVHAGIHGILLALIFGWAAIPLAWIHLIIDTRVPIVWWGTKVVKQTQPQGKMAWAYRENHGNEMIPAYDMGIEVRIWTDQVFHIACLALAALLVA